MKGLEWIKTLDENDKYNFVASFSASENEKEEIHREFLKFLNKIESIVKKASNKNLYQLNFDLFKWL